VKLLRLERLGKPVDQFYRDVQLPLARLVLRGEIKARGRSVWDKEPAA
jgi:hypothetical protein